MPKVRLQDEDGKKAYQPYSEAPDKQNDLGNKIGLQIFKSQLGLNNEKEKAGLYAAASKQPGLEPLLKLLLQDGKLKTLSGKPIAEKGVEPKEEDMKKLFTEMEKGNVIFQKSEGVYEHLAMDVGKDGTRTFLYATLEDSGYEKLLTDGVKNGLLNKDEMKTVLQENGIDLDGKDEDSEELEEEPEIITPPTADTLQEARMSKEEAQKALTALGKAPEKSFFQFFIDIFQRIVGGKTYDQKLKDYNDTRDELLDIAVPNLKNQKHVISATLQSRWEKMKDMTANLDVEDVLGLHVMNALTDHFTNPSVNPKIVEAVSDPVKFSEMTERIGLALEKTDAYKRYVQKFEEKYPDGISTEALANDENVNKILQANENDISEKEAPYKAPIGTVSENTEFLLEKRSDEQHELFLQSVEKLIPTGGLDGITKEFNKLLNDYPDLKIAETQVTNELENKAAEAKEPEKKEAKSLKETVLDELCNYANEEKTKEAPDMLLRKALFLRMVELQPEDKRESVLAQMDTALNEGHLFEGEKMTLDDQNLIYRWDHRGRRGNLLESLPAKHGISKEDMPKLFEESIARAEAEKEAKKKAEKELGANLPEKLARAEKTLEEAQRERSAAAQYKIATGGMSFDDLEAICAFDAIRTCLREMKENKRQPNAQFLDALSDHEKIFDLAIKMQSNFIRTEKSKDVYAEWEKAYPEKMIDDLHNHEALKQITAENKNLIRTKNIDDTDDFKPLVQNESPEKSRKIVDSVLSATVGSKMKKGDPQQEFLSIIDTICAPKIEVTAGKKQPAPAKMEDSPVYHLVQPVVKDLCKAAYGEKTLHEPDMQLKKALCLKAVELDSKTGSKLLETSLPMMDSALKKGTLLGDVKLTDGDKKSIQEWEKAPAGKDLLGTLAKNHGLDSAHLVKTVVESLGKPTINMNKTKPESTTITHETKKDGITETGPKK